MGLFDSLAKGVAGQSKGYQKLGDPLNLFPDQDTAGVRPQWVEPTDIWRGSQGYLGQQYELNAKPDVNFESNMQGLNDRLAGINLNKEGLEEIRKRALGTGPSEWANLATGKQGLEEATQRDKAAKTEAGSRSEAMSQLASKGGLSSGARERLATAGARNYAQSLQDISRSGASARADIGMQDEQNRLALLSQLPGMEVQSLAPEFQKTSMWTDLANTESTRKQALDLANRDYDTTVDKYNVDNRLNAIKNKDAANMAKYSNDMAAYAAAKSADALANSSKDKGGGKGGGK